MSAADTIAKVASKKAAVVVKSTVPVGTCDKVQARLAVSKVELEVVSNPEFLKEGDAGNDFFKPDRVVVGGCTDEARELLRQLYAPLRLSGERLVVTDPRSSELINYASNTMVAIRISFMNELSRLCHATGADIQSVHRGVRTHSRIGKKSSTPATATRVPATSGARPTRSRRDVDIKAPGVAMNVHADRASSY